MMSTLTHPKKSGYRIGSRYPLLPIKNRIDYERAIIVVQELFGRDDLDADQTGYLETLTLLISAYEEAHENLDELAEGVTPLDVLKSIMESHGMKSKDLGE